MENPLFVSRTGSFASLDDILRTREPADRAYLLVDASRVPNLAEKLEGFRLRSLCLFDGKAREDYGDLAPHLVDLGRIPFQSRGFLWGLLKDGHALLLFSEESMRDLKRHLKKFNKAKIEDKTVFVKYANAVNFLYIMETLDGLSKLFEPVKTVIFAGIGKNEKLGVFIEVYKKCRFPSNDDVEA